jgi:Peroxiredoxin
MTPEIADRPDAGTATHHRAKILGAGDRAPDFSLHSTPDQRVSLDDFRGRAVVLAFYPADWSPVCGDQMALYNQVLPEFRRLGAELLGVSVDGVWCHTAFAEARTSTFRCLPTSSRRVPSRAHTAPTATPRE